MKRAEFQDNRCTFNLDFSDGTGFEWAVVFKTDNLEVIDQKGIVERNDPTSTGGRGTTGIECILNEGDEAVLILKYARPWENEGDFLSYYIKAEDGVITDIQEKEENLYTDFVSEYEFRSDDYLSLFIFKDWEFRLDDNEEKVIYYLKPAEEEGWISITHAEKELEGEELTFGKRDFIVGEGFIYRTDGILCRTGEAEWAEIYLADILKLLDMVSYE